MKRFKTLRVRFALWVAGLVLLILTAFGGLMYFGLGQALLTSIDNSLRLSASQVTASIDITDNTIANDSIPDMPVADPRGRGLTIRILYPSGQVLQSAGPYRFLPVDADSLQAAQAYLTSFASQIVTSTQEAVRFYTAPLIQNDRLIGIVQVGETLIHVQQALERLLAGLLISGPLLIAVAALGGLFLASRALTPIDMITRTARHLAEDSADLSARLNLPPTDDEVGRLAATFDAMLARLESNFKREQQFTADASHELRTPLAAMQAILSVIREERRTPEDYEAALADLAEETNRLRNLTGDLLRLARGYGARPPLRERVDLSTLINDVADSMSPLAEAKGLTLASTVPNGLMTIGDSDDLIRLFVNLLDNAIKYTEQGHIDVAGSRNTTDLQIKITDTGSGILAEHLPHIFDRFYRADTARTSSGAGLGLAIALDIARAHGGSIEVQSSVGQGTTFTVTLTVPH